MEIKINDGEPIPICWSREEFIALWDNNPKEVQKVLFEYVVEELEGSIFELKHKCIEPKDFAYEFDGIDIYICDSGVILAWVAFHPECEFKFDYKVWGDFIRRFENECE